MNLFYYFAKRNRLKRRLLSQAEEGSLSVNVQTCRIAIDYIREVYKRPEYIEAINRFEISLYYPVDVLSNNFLDAYECILEEQDPLKVRNQPRAKETTFRNWFLKDGLEYPYEPMMGTLLANADMFLSVLWDSYEIEGKHRADYRLEQAYCSLCDILTIAEAFFAEQ